MKKFLPAILLLAIPFSLLVYALIRDNPNQYRNMKAYRAVCLETGHVAQIMAESTSEKDSLFAYYDTVSVNSQTMIIEGDSQYAVPYVIEPQTPEDRIRYYQMKLIERQTLDLIDQGYDRHSAKHIAMVENEVIPPDAEYIALIND